MANEIAFAKRTVRTLVCPVAVLALQAGVAEAAEAAVNRQPRAISSANLNITMSVATRYKVQAKPAVRSAGLDAASSGLCISSNAAPTALPMTLMLDGVTIPVHRCGSTITSPVGLRRSFHTSFTGVMLIRPE